MKVRTTHICLLLIFISSCLTGCAAPQPIAAPILPGQDPLVVNTERAQNISLSFFQHVTDLDHNNLAFMKTNLPDVHNTVQVLRKEFPTAFRESRDALAAYKAAKKNNGDTTQPSTQPAVVEAANVMNQKLAALQRLEQSARNSLAAMQTALK